MATHEVHIDNSTSSNGRLKSVLAKVECNVKALNSAKDVFLEARHCEEPETGLEQAVQGGEGASLQEPSIETNSGFEQATPNTSPEGVVPPKTNGARSKGPRKKVESKPETQERSKESQPIKSQTESQAPEERDLSYLDQYESHMEDVTLWRHAHIDKFEEYEEWAYDDFVSKNIDQILQDSKSRSKIKDQKVWDAIGRTVKRSEAAKSLEVVYEAEPQFTPAPESPMDASSDGASALGAGEFDNPNGFTPFPPVEETSSFTQEVLVPAAIVLDSSASEKLALEKDKKTIIKVERVNGELRYTRVPDTRSRFQKFKDSFKPYRRVDVAALPAIRMPSEEPEVIVSFPGAISVTESNGHDSVYKEDIDKAKENLKILWPSIPEAKRKSDLVLGEVEEMDGDIDKFFQSREEVYNKIMNGNESAKLEAVFMDTLEVTDRALAALGNEKAVGILNQARSNGATPAV